jgi:hypothetical protein
MPTPLAIELGTQSGGAGGCLRVCVVAQTKPFCSTGITRGGSPLTGIPRQEASRGAAKPSASAKGVSAASRFLPHWQSDEGDQVGDFSCFFFKIARGRHLRPAATCYCSPGGLSATVVRYVFRRALVFPLCSGIIPLPFTSISVDDRSRCTAASGLAHTSKPRRMVPRANNALQRSVATHRDPGSKSPASCRPAEGTFLIEPHVRVS